MPWGFTIDSNKLKDATKTGEITFDRPEPVENLITWAYDSYAPTANLVGDKRTALSATTSVVPPQAYDGKGNVVWLTDYYIYETSAKLLV